MVTAVILSVVCVILIRAIASTSDVINTIRDNLTFITKRITGLQKERSDHGVFKNFFKNILKGASTVTSICGKGYAPVKVVGVLLKIAAYFSDNIYDFFTDCRSIPARLNDLISERTKLEKTLSSVTTVRSLLVSGFIGTTIAMIIQWVGVANG